MAHAIETLAILGVKPSGKKTITEKRQS